ncbi:hypothetical protein [Mycobacterium sp. AZCC_0083]|uniref:hypothetical protein n=1 Tax=Mycobacterium sp. AZCC_0083 TaxID=2735882 RepID=UPI0016110CCB|nr:hypothetical protein [Mycobacterium sp. AZCC_0083]MBB5165927.1 hypothetical protein [Mycobacterium sp. AZCC_0083]
MDCALWTWSPGFGGVGVEPAVWDGSLPPSDPAGVMTSCTDSGTTGTGSLAAVGVVAGTAGGCSVTSAAGVVTTGVSGAVTVGVVLGSTCSWVLDGDDVGDDVEAGVGSASVAWPASFVDVLAPPELLTCISGADSAACAGCEVDPVDVVGAAGWFVCVVDDVLVSAGSSVAAWWLSLVRPVGVEVGAESDGESDDLVSDGSDPVSACASGSPRP